MTDLITIFLVFQGSNFFSTLLFDLVRVHFLVEDFNVLDADNDPNVEEGWHQLVDLVQHLLDALEPNCHLPRPLDFLTGSVVGKTRLLLSHEVGAHN